MSGQVGRSCMRLTSATIHSAVCDTAIRLTVYTFLKVNCHVCYKLEPSLLPAVPLKSASMPYIWPFSVLNVLSTGSVGLVQARPNKGRTNS